MDSNGKEIKFVVGYDHPKNIGWKGWYIELAEEKDIEIISYGDMLFSVNGYGEYSERQIFDTLESAEWAVPKGQSYVLYNPKKLI